MLDGHIRSKAGAGCMVLRSKAGAGGLIDRSPNSGSMVKSSSSQSGLSAVRKSINNYIYLLSGMVSMKRWTS